MDRHHAHHVGALVDDLGLGLVERRLWSHRAREPAREARQICGEATVALEHRRAHDELLDVGDLLQAIRRARVDRHELEAIHDLPQQRLGAEVLDERLERTQAVAGNTRIMFCRACAHTAVPS